MALTAPLSSVTAAPYYSHPHLNPRQAHPTSFHPFPHSPTTYNPTTAASTAISTYATFVHDVNHSHNHHHGPTAIINHRHHHHHHNVSLGLAAASLSSSSSSSHYDSALSHQGPGGGGVEGEDGGSWVVERGAGVVGDGASYRRIMDPHWLSYAPLPYSFHVGVGLLMILTAVSSIVGNGLVLWAFFRFRSLRTSSNQFIISLALADILMSSVDFPLFAAASFLGHWPFGFHVCQVYGATTGAAGLVTINTLAAISYDRYTVLVRRVGPVHHISKHMTCTVIVSIWVASVMWVTLPLAGWSHFTLEGIGTSCSFDYLTRGPRNVSYVVILMVANFLCPLALIVYSYVRIFVSVSSVQRSLMDCSLQIAVGTQRMRLRRQTEWKTATNLMLIVGFFCLAWTPYCIVALLGLFGDSRVVSPLVSAVPCIFAKIATVSNPPIYSIGHPKFRKKISYLIKTSLRWWTWGRGAPPSSNSPNTTQDLPPPEMEVFPNAFV